MRHTMLFRQNERSTQQKLISQMKLKLTIPFGSGKGHIELCEQVRFPSALSCLTFPVLGLQVQLHQPRVQQNKVDW